MSFFKTMVNEGQEHFISELEKQNQIKIEEIQRKHKLEIEDINRRNKNEIEDLKREFNRIIDKESFAKDNEIKTLNSEIENLKKLLVKNEDIWKKEKELIEVEAKHTANAANMALQIERDTALARVDHLEKAFETLGFDVKDMKDILNKVVDAVVAKHENNIHIIK